MRDAGHKVLDHPELEKGRPGRACEVGRSNDGADAIPIIEQYELRVKAARQDVDWPRGIEQLRTISQKVVVEDTDVAALQRDIGGVEIRVRRPSFAIEGTIAGGDDLTTARALYRRAVASNLDRVILWADRARILARSDRPDTMPG